MAKPEWGNKRHCLHCGAAFYDLNKDPITCPKCGTVFQPDALLKPRRAKPDEKPVAPKKPPKKAAEDLEDEIVDDDVTDDDLIEDDEDLEDEDVSEVIEGPDDKENRDT